MKISDYKVGDEVRIRNVIVGAEASGYIFLERMKKYCGATSKIIEVHSWVIRLECTGENTGWLSEWFTAEFFSDRDFEI